ncbi:MAG: hypothetical protein M3444_06500 [Acidobacteriota bacterium]|nr:hypothetical protein [Acidobacteriota bacterium]
MTDASTARPTIVCIASFFKGNEFLRECKRGGARVKALSVEEAAKFEEELRRLTGLKIVSAYQRGPES